MTTAAAPSDFTEPGHRKWQFAGSIAYLLAAWIALWGLHVPDGKTSVPLGIESIATVPLFNLWTIGWNADRAQECGADYWQAPIFGREPDTFALSEAQPHFLLAAPLTKATSPVVTYNVFLLLSLFLNGLFARRLVQRTGSGRMAAFIAGLLAVLLPYIHWSLGVLQLVPVWGVLWTLERMWDYSRSPRLTNGLLIGLAGGITYLLCNYYGLFLAMLTPSVLLVMLGREILRVRTVVHLLAGACFAGLLASPVLWKQWQVLNRPEYQREEQLVQQLSARPLHLLVPPADRLPALGHQFWQDDIPVMMWRLGVGTVWAVMAAAGLIAGLCRRGRRRWTLMVIVLGATAGIFACGLNVSIAGYRPYETLQEIVPGLKLLRSPNRFAMFVQLACLLLAAEAVSGLLSIAHRNSHSKLRRWMLMGVAVGWTGVIIWQVGPQPSPVAEIPEWSEHAAWIDCLRRSTDKDEIIACLPFPRGTMPEDYEPTTEWMYLGLAHGRRMVNGYSGYFPRSFVDLKDALMTFPDDASLRALIDAGVTICVIRSPPEGAPPALPRAAALELICTDEANQITVYRLHHAAVQ